MKGKRNILLTFALLGALAPSALALSYNQEVTPEVIMGEGIDNGGWTVDQANGIELGLRAKVRFPSPQNTFTNVFGTYSFPTGAAGGTQSAERPLWNFEWSINSDYLATGAANPLNTYTYELGIDLNPSLTKSFAIYSLTTMPRDNSFGDNTTANGAGVEANSVAQYSSYLSIYNVAQNSWSPHWSGTFDPTVDGVYDFYLRAYESSGDRVASTSMKVIVGNGSSVPDTGSTLVLLGGALTGLGALRRKFRG